LKIGIVLLAKRTDLNPVMKDSKEMKVEKRSKANLNIFSGKKN
jgi:hypothetical protein